MLYADAMEPSWQDRKHARCSRQMRQMLSNEGNSSNKPMSPFDCSI